MSTYISLFASRLYFMLCLRAHPFPPITYAPIVWISLLLISASFFLQYYEMSYGLNVEMHKQVSVLFYLFYQDICSDFNGPYYIHVRIILSCYLFPDAMLTKFLSRLMFSTTTIDLKKWQYTRISSNGIFFPCNFSV